MLHCTHLRCRASFSMETCEDDFGRQVRAELLTVVPLPAMITDLDAYNVRMEGRMARDAKWSQHWQTKAWTCPKHDPMVLDAIAWDRRQRAAKKRR